MPKYRIEFDEAHGDWVIYWDQDDGPLGAYETKADAEEAIKDLTSGKWKDQVEAGEP